MMLFSGSSISFPPKSSSPLLSASPKQQRGRTNSAFLGAVRVLLAVCGNPLAYQKFLVIQAGTCRKQDLVKTRVGNKISKLWMQTAAALA